MNPHSILQRRVAIAAQRYDSLHKICWLLRNRQRIPAHLVGRRGHFVEWAAAQQCRLPELAIGLVHYRRANAVTPGAAIERARSREGCAAELLGVKTQRRVLRRVLSLRQRAGLGFGGKLVAEPALIVELS